MSVGPRPRRPIKVVALVVGYWLVGNVLQAALAWLLGERGQLGADAAGWTALIVAWGALFAVTYAYRHHLDAWLRE